MQSLNQLFPQFSGKTAVLRANFDVPLDNGQVGDTTRIEDAVPTIKKLREQQCKVVILAHAGRPDGMFSQDASLAPIATLLPQLVGEPVALAAYQSDFHQISLPDSAIILVDNLRFWPGEEENDPEFAKHLASFGDFYINESFAVCHRKHASIVGIPQYLPHAAGLSLEKEMNILSTVRNNPEHPLVVVIGGAKLETKAPLVDAFAHTADKILVGGKVAIELRDKPHTDNVVIADLTEDQKDITPESAQAFADIIMNAKTVVWNGTMGVFEEPEHQQGTRIVAESINTTPAFTLMGGGDTETALTVFNLESGIDHISTGGGAMLTYLVDGSLVGVEALNV